jgi:hypothetical protein
MLTIKIPANNLAEREYINYLLFTERLNLNYMVEIADFEATIIVLPNGAEIFIEDHFFNLHTEDKSYLKKENLPQQITQLEDNALGFANLPVFYGMNKMNVLKERIIVKADIIGMLFFFYSRWEEYVITEKDRLGRVDEDKLFMVQHQLNERPIADEYVDLVARMITFLGYEKFKQNKIFKIFPTHDVDFVKKWRTSFHAFKEFGGDILVRKNPARALYHLRLWSSVKLGNSGEPNDTIHFLIDRASVNGYSAAFFFKVGGETPLDSFSDEDLQHIENWAVKIIESKHALGLHTSILTAQNSALITEELVRYRNLVKYQICCSRQHYLRLIIPITWRILDENRIGWDSSCGFSNHIGFRCGTASAFRVFDIEERKMLKLKERPLIVMDTAIVEHMNIQETEAINKVRKLKAEIEKFGGNFIFLLHNSSLNAFEYKNYQKLIDELYSKN